MTMLGKLPDPTDDGDATPGGPSRLALLICRRPAVQNAVARLLRRQPDLDLRVVKEDIGALDAATEAAVGRAAIVIFDLPAAAAADEAPVRRLLALGGAATRFLAVTEADLPLSRARGLMKLGVQDILPAGADEADLAETLAPALTDLLAAAPPPSATGGGGARRPGTVIAVAGGRGGLGATTLAVNLADQLRAPQGLLSKTNSHSVAILDLDIQFGNAAACLDLEDNGAMIEIARAPVAPDRAFLDAALLRHSSGLRVLAAPKAAMPLEAIDADRIGAIIDALRADFDYVLIDLPRALVSWLEAVIRRTDLLLMVADTSVPAVNGARRLLDLLTEDAPGLRTEIVINRERRPLVPSHAHKLAADALGLPLRHFLADDMATARRAVDRGEVLADVAPNSSLTKSLKRLAGHVLNTFPARADAGRTQGGL